MPRKAHKSEYTILAVLGLITALALLAMIGQGWLREDSAGRTGVRTTRSVNVDGVRACYTLWERLGIPVERSNRMLLAPHLDGAAVILLIDPIVPVGAGELADLGVWLARGGVLITTELLTDLAPALSGLPQQRWASPRHRVASNGADHLTEVPADARALPLARDIGTTDFETDATLDPNRPNAKRQANVLEPLFADAHGARMAQHSIGRGRLVLISDSSFLANGRIGRGDNAVLATNLVSYALAQSNGQRVVFDEYHFGGGGNEGFRLLAGMLLTTSAGWAVLALTAAGVLLLLYQGRQFGPRRGLGKQRRRSQMEYVYAVAATYRAAGAHRLTLKLIYNWLRQRLLHRTGLPTGASNHRMAEELARRGRADAAEYQRVLDHCDELLAQTAVSPRQLATAVEQLAQIEKESLDGFGNGK